MPRVKGGDEPHYLVIINSLLNDGDLEVGNNYDSANQGSFQAGNKFMGMSLDRHTLMMMNGKVARWENVFESVGNSEKWAKSPQGYPVPILKPGIAPDVLALPQYPIHPPGIAFLLAPFLWMVRGTAYVEPLALFCSNLAIIFSIFVFRGIVSRFTKDATLINLSAFLLGVGTPLWAYGRALFTESFLILFALCAYWVTLEKKSGLWAGIFIGLGMLVKPPFALLAIPLGIFWLVRKEWRAVFFLTLGPILCAVFFFYVDYKMFGSVLLPYAFPFFNPVQGALGIWFSWNHGILAFSPFIFPILFSWGKFLKEKRREAFLWAGGFLIYFLLMCSYTGWSGFWCFGPREILPVVPFLMVPTCYTLMDFSRWGRLKQWGFIVLCLLSIVFNALGAMDGYWDSHPLTIFLGNIS